MVGNEISLSKDVTAFFSSLVNAPVEKLQHDVKINIVKTLHTIEFTQNAPWKLTEEQYNIWPKIYSINLEQNDKQIVTLEFKNDPNFKAIKNILQIYCPDKDEHKFEVIEMAAENVVINTLTINKNSIYVLAHLMNIYNKMSKEAGALIWEALRYVTQDAMDKDPDNGNWKMKMHYMVKAWADSVHKVDGDSCANKDDYSFMLVKKSNDYIAKVEYGALSDEAKEIFIKAILSQVVKLNTIKLLNYVSSSAGKISIVQDAFDSVEKCDSYISNNIPNASDFIKKMHNVTEKELVTKFEPNFWEKMFSNNDKMSKHVKYGGAGVAASLSLLDKAQVIGKSLPIVQKIFTVIDVSKILLSLVYAKNEMFPSVKEEDMQSEVDLTDLSYKFLCMNVICNPKSLLDLTEESAKELMKFYSSFIHATIKDVANNSLITSNFLLEQFSNATYIHKLGLLDQANVFLENKDGTAFQMTALLAEHNHTTCHDSLLQMLGSYENNFAELV